MRVILAMAVAASLIGCGPAEEVTAEPAAPADTTSQTSGLAGGTWQMTSFEECYAMYGGSCYSRRWEPQCRWQTGSTGNPRGLACANAGSSCWWVASDRYVYEFTCQ
ncbi:hypothetical protein ACLESD_10315 [Pyxidicoccus sp. 3LFB2]